MHNVPEAACVLVFGVLFNDAVSYYECIAPMERELNMRTGHG